MFERFTESARQALAAAQAEASALGHNYIGTEHLLLGCLAESTGEAPAFLESAGLSTEGLRERVLEIAVPTPDEPPTSHKAFTPRAKTVLEAAARESEARGHPGTGSRHLLLALAVEREGIAGQAMAEKGITPSAMEPAMAEVRVRFRHRRWFQRRSGP